MRKQEQKGKITALYERLSHDDGRSDESVSVENQKRILEDYARKNGFTNVRHFTDDGVRGTTFKRPGLDAMVDEIRAGNVATVIVKDQSRIGRDVVEVGLLKRTFDEYNVRFIAANDNLDTANGFDIMSIFRDVINEWYVADTSRKIKTVFKSRMEKGLRCSGAVPYGYLASKEEKGEWVIDDTAIRNYDKWKQIRVNMDTIAENNPVDTSLTLFGRTFKYPVFAGPVGAVQLHYGDCLDDVTYNDILVSACAKNGIAAFTGDGTDPNVMAAATKAIKNADGAGIPTVKPWNIETIREKMKLVHESGAFAVAMDIDAAVLPLLKNLDPPAGSKTVSELCDIIQMAGTPFIVKGIMTVKGALKAKEAGASAIIVSNHGGRVLDQCPATAEVLESIVKALEGSGIKILVDGGIRSGTDVFKALALGADGVLIARPFVTAVYGGKADGVRAYIDKIGTELEDTMKMCGVSSLDEITRDCVMTF